MVVLKARAHFWLVAEPLLKHRSDTRVSEVSQGNGSLPSYRRTRIGLEQRAQHRPGLLTSQLTQYVHNLTSYPGPWFAALMVQQARHHSCVT